MHYELSVDPLTSLATPASTHSYHSLVATSDQTLGSRRLDKYLGLNGRTQRTGGGIGDDTSFRRDYYCNFEYCMRLIWL